jgi:hypothetical protein
MLIKETRINIFCTSADEKEQRAQRLSHLARTDREKDRESCKKKARKIMGNWTEQDLRPHMKVYSSNGEHVGHVADAYEDSFLIHKGYFFPTDRYLPYSAIAHLEENRIDLTLSSAEVQDTQWEKRPDYEHHLGDPTQLFYDRSHGINDPYDDTGFEPPNP